MKKRAKFWMAMFTIVLLCALWVSYMFINTKNSMWIGAIGGAIGITYALIKLFNLPDKIQLPKGPKMYYLLLSIVTLVICTSTAIFFDKITAFTLLLGSALRAGVCFFNFVFSKKTKFENTLNSEAACLSFSMGTSLLGITLVTFLFQDTLPLLGFILGAAIANPFMSKAEQDSLFDSFSATVTAAIAIGALTLNLMGVYLPLVLGALGIFAIIFSALFHSKKPLLAFYAGISIKTLLFLAGSFFVINLWFNEIGGTNYFWVLALGTLAAYLLVACSKIKYNVLGYFLQGALIIGTLIFSFWLAYGIESYPLGSFGIAIASLGAIIGCFGGLLYLPALSIEHNIVKPKRAFIETAGIFSTLSVLFALIVLCEKDAVEILNPYIFISLIFGGILAFLFFDIHKSQSQDPLKRVLLTVFAVIAPLLMGLFTNLEATLAMLIGAIVAGVGLGLREKNLSTLTQVRLMGIVSLVFMALFNK